MLSASSLRNYEPSVQVNSELKTNTYPSPRRAWSMVSLLTILYIFSFLDRTIIVLLIEPIKADLGLSDTQISLLYGFAFALFYTFLGIPIARLADRRSRRTIIMVGVAIWSVMTAICGITRNFGQLFAARIGVGVGEAALSPAAYSLISDSFPPAERARAMSVYTMGLYLGVGFSLLLGGVVIEWIGATGSIELPIVGEIRAWQVTFIAVGLPGLLLAGLMMTVREPVRQELGLAQANTEVDQVSLRDSFEWFAKRWRFYIVFCGAMSCLVLYSYSLTAWTPSFFIRTHDWTSLEVSRYYGLVVLIFGPTGILFGGWWASRRARRGDIVANVRVAVVCFALLVVPAGAMTLLDDPNHTLVLMAVVKFVSGLPLGIAVAAMHEVTPNRLRAQAVGLYMFTINLIGLGFGPTAVALLTDYLFGDPQMLRYSMAIVGSISCFIGLLLTLYAQKHFRKQKTSYASSEHSTNSIDAV